MQFGKAFAVRGERLLLSYPFLLTSPLFFWQNVWKIEKQLEMKFSGDPGPRQRA